MYSGAAGVVGKQWTAHSARAAAEASSLSTGAAATYANPRSASADAVFRGGASSQQPSQQPSQHPSGVSYPQTSQQTSQQHADSVISVPRWAASAPSLGRFSAFTGGASSQQSSQQHAASSSDDSADPGDQRSAPALHGAGSPLAVNTEAVQQFAGQHTHATHSPSHQEAVTVNTVRDQPAVGSTSLSDLLGDTAGEGGSPFWRGAPVSATSKSESSGSTGSKSGFGGSISAFGGSISVNGASKSGFGGSGFGGGLQRLNAAGGAVRSLAEESASGFRQLATDVSGAAGASAGLTSWRAEPAFTQVLNYYALTIICIWSGQPP